MPDQPAQTGFWRRLRSWSAGPVAMCIWLAPFVLSAVILFNELGMIRCRCYQYMVYHVFEHNTALHVYDAADYWFDFDQVPTEFVHRGAAYTARHGPTMSGGLFPTSRRFDTTLSMHPGLSPDEQRDVEAQVARHIRAEYAANNVIPEPDTARWLDYLEHRIGHASDPIWWGYALNTLTALFAFLALRAIIVNARRARARIAALRRTQRGRCPTCAYDLTGLTSSICPECGRATAQQHEEPRTQSRGREPAILP